MPVVPAERSWAELFSDTLDDVIGYFLPKDEPNYAPAVKASDFLPTEQPQASFILDVEIEV